MSRVRSWRRSWAAHPFIRLLSRLVHESPSLLGLGIATAIGQSALLVPIALLVRSVFDDQLAHEKAGGLIVTGLLILLLYTAAAALGYLSRIAVLKTTTAVAERIRNEVVAKLHTVSQGWHDAHPAGEVQTLVIQDTERFEVMLGDLANPVLPAALVSATLGVVAFVMNPILFLAVLAVVPALLVVTYFLSRRARTHGRLWGSATNAFGADIHRMLRGMTLTKVAGAESEQARLGSERTRELAEHMRAYGSARALYGAVHSALGAVAGTLVLVVGGISVAHGSITLGDLLGFYAVLGLLLRQLYALALGAANVTIGVDSTDRLERLLETPVKDPYAEGTEVLRFRGEITVERVTFAYSSSPVLSELDLVVRPSERVALVGPNGAGKSTLVSLVVGLYRPQTGRLLADGVPFERLDMRNLRRQVGVVLQDPVLLPGTIRENIAYGRHDVDDAQIAAAAEIATASSFIDRLPNGYDTVVGDEGVGLSGGQRQRVAIARALIGEPTLLLFDEPTTYLDDATATALMANLSSLAHAPTVLLVTHDPQAASHADRVIELREGRIVSDSMNDRSASDLYL